MSETTLCLSAPGARASKEFAPRAAAAGCVVIDKSSPFRMDSDVPLVVPEVNPHDLLNLWIVSDNLRKGAALNAVQIAEVFTRDYLRRA